MTDPSIAVSLDAVIVTMRNGEPQILVIETPVGPAIPSGPLDPGGDHTLERAMRRWITEQAGVEIGYAEQLYTFGDLERGPQRMTDDRLLSVAYLALVNDASVEGAAGWVALYDLFPWEDRRSGPPDIIATEIVPQLEAWADVGVDPRAEDDVESRAN